MGRNPPGSRTGAPDAEDGLTRIVCRSAGCVIEGDGPDQPAVCQTGTAISSAGRSSSAPSAATQIRCRMAAEARLSETTATPADPSTTVLFHKMSNPKIHHDVASMLSPFLPCFLNQLCHAVQFFAR